MQELKEKEDPRLQAALEFARRGLPVFPVTEKKLPAVKDWENAATTDETQIRKWFEEVLIGGCNYGFPAGRAGILIIDTDVDKKIGGAVVNGEDSLKDYLLDNAGYLPDTMRVRTPSGGIHRYYRAEGFRSKNALLPAVDIKSCGGYVVIPGSITEKGRYCIEAAGLDGIAELPDWFKEAYGRKRKAETKAGKKDLNFRAAVTPDTPDKIRMAEALIEGWPEVVEGERNDNLYRMARDLCKLGISRGRAWELYRERGIDAIGLDPESSEVSATIKSAYGNMEDFGEDSPEIRFKRSLRLFDEAGLPEDPEDPGSRGDPFSEKKEVGTVTGFDWNYLAKKDVPPRRWFIQDWLSADPGYTVLFTGRGGTGKSALILDLMRSLATGEPFCGMEVLRGSKSMYVSCEDSEEEIARRVKQRSLDTAAVPDGVIRICPRSGMNNILCAPGKNGVLVPSKFLDELKAAGREFFREGGGVLILDTLSDIAFLNENDRSQVAQFVKQYLNRLGADLGVSIIVLAHPAKFARTDGQGFSGSTAWEGAFRCRWELNYKDPTNIGGLLELVLAKSNSARAGARIALENKGGTFLAVDTARREEGLKQEIVRLIGEAYEEGEAFGQRSDSARPIGKADIKDPVTGEKLSEEIITEKVKELLAERRIETFRTEWKRGLRIPG